MKFCTNNLINVSSGFHQLHLSSEKTRSLESARWIENWVIFNKRSAWNKHGDWESITTVQILGGKYMPSTYINEWLFAAYLRSK